MKSYNFKESPIEVHGIPFYNEKKTWERLPVEVRRQMPNDYAWLGRRCAGARVCFRTNAPTFTVKVSLEFVSLDTGMSMCAASGINVLVGERSNARFAGFARPDNYESPTYEKNFSKSGEYEDVTIFLPRNQPVADVTISIDDKYTIEAPTPYTYPPMLFYGSSITEGGCATRVSNAYNAIVSNRLNADYYNFGFSGNAKGELVMADYINTIDMSVFVYDYDHNAPTADHLEATHEPFFKRIREKNPDLPIVMMTRPDFEVTPDTERRRQIIKKTYDNAVAAGDKNVYYINGKEFFTDEIREMASIDGCHPNDLGFFCMAEKVTPVIREILEKRYPDAK